MLAKIYARCSTNESKQDITLQTEPLIDFCKRYQWDYEVLTEYASGKDMKNRPVFKYLMKEAYNKAFDVLLVTKIDRLSRSMPDFVDTALKLDQYGIRLIAKDQGIDTDNRNPASRLLMNILAAMAEFERELIRERVKTGIDKRKSKGLSLGRPKTPFSIKQARYLIDDEKMSYRKAAESMGVNVNTLIRRIKEYQSGSLQNNL